jgi:VWFA-related protein
MRQRILLRGVAALGALLALVPMQAGWGQAGAQPQTQSTGEQGRAGSGTPVFRTAANLVLVDVVVRDKGQPVNGLKAADFVVREDGKEQKLSVFEEHRGSDALQAGTRPQLPPHVYSDTPQYALTSAANVLLLDALNTPLTDQVYVRRQMLAYLKTIPPGTRIAVFTMASHLRMITGFTTDTAEVAKALGPGRGNAQQSPLLDPLFDQALDLSQVMAQANGMPGASLEAMQQFQADTKSFEQNLRGQLTLDALNQIARYLSTIPGRKNLIWFSASFPLAFPQREALGGTPDFSEPMKKAAEMLALSRIAVYPVDSRGLLGMPSTEAGTEGTMPTEMQEAAGMVGGGGGGLPGGVTSGTSISRTLAQQDTNFMNEVAWSHLNMDQIAKETGGKAFYNRNALGQVVGEAIADGSSYYTLGYAPENRKYDGTLRRIEVKTESGHYDLEYRHAYFADDPGAAEKWTAGKRNPVIDAMEHGTLPLSQVTFEVRVLPEGDPALAGEKATMERTVLVPKGMQHPKHYLVDYWIDPRAVDAKPTADGKQHREIQLTQVVYDGEGGRQNYTDSALGVDLTDAQATQALTDGILLHQEIDLPAGEVFLRLGVHDILSGRIGTVEIPVKVAE